MTGAPHRTPDHDPDTSTVLDVPPLRTAGDNDLAITAAGPDVFAAARTLELSGRTDITNRGFSFGSTENNGSLWFSNAMANWNMPVPTLDITYNSPVRRTSGSDRQVNLAADAVSSTADKAPQVVSKLQSWQTVYEPVRGQGGAYGSTPPDRTPPVYLPDHTLQKFLADPVKAGYAAAAGDPRHANGKYGTMFRIAEMQNDAFFQQMTGMSKDAWIAKWGDAYKQKYGFDLTGVHFRVVDTGGSIKGAGRVDLAVDPGSKSRPEIEAWNSPHVKHGFSMEVLNTKINNDGTIAPPGRVKPPKREGEPPVVRPPRGREVLPAPRSGDVTVPEWQKGVDPKLISTIEDPKASFNDKASAFTKLWEQGPKTKDGKVRVALKDGETMREFDIHRISMGKVTKLMNVHAADTAGGQHPVLRWVDRNGAISKQKDRRGDSDFHGKWWGANVGDSTVSQYAERATGAPVVSPPEVRPPVVRPPVVRPPEVTPPVVKDKVPPPAVLPPRADGDPLMLDAVTDPKIVNDVGNRPGNGKKIEPVYIGYKGTITGPDARGRRQVIADQPLWLDRPAAESLALANKILEAKGKRVILASEGTTDQQNSAGRTHTQQRLAQGIHAPEGRSMHERGSAMDVRNFQDPDVDAALRAVGWRGKFVRGDEWHYQFESPQKAAKLWQQYGDQIRQDIERRRRKP